MNDIADVLQQITPPQATPAAEGFAIAEPTILYELVLPMELADLRARLDSDGKTYRIITGRPGRNDCLNCGGIGWIDLAERISGPYQQPPMSVQAGYHCDWWETGWAITQRHTFACPVCTKPEQRFAGLWENSGLKPSERSWHIDYLAGKPGKENALSTARIILSCLPYPSGLFIFHGGYGVGKSGVLRSLVASAIRAGISARYTTAAELLNEIKATFNDANANPQAVLRAYQRYLLLAVDEIEKVGTSNYDMQQLFVLFDERYRSIDQAATILATNCPPDELPVMYSYLSSRLQDGVRVLVGGCDLRGK
jgi:hypothetical protein